jgi:hypothetical protein
MEMKEMVMKHKIAMMAGLALVVLIGAGALYSQQKTHTSAAQQDKIAALQELRDSGVITAQEYESKVKALQASPPAASPTSATSAPAHFAKIASGTRRVDAADPTYQITAFTMEIPADWKFAGTIARPPGCHGHGASVKFTVQSPDGLSAVVALPGVAWDWASDENAQKYLACPGIDIDTAASFLLNIAVPNLRSNAKIVAVLPLPPEGQASLKDQLEKEIQQNAAMGNFNQVNPKWTLDGARVRVQYDRDGHSTEEMITAVVQCNEQTMPAMAILKQAAYRKRSCFSRGTSISRAPQGHLDEMIALPQLKNMTKSMQPNPDWQNRIAADQQAAFQQAMAANNRQAAANLQHFKEQGEQRQAQAKAFDQGLRESTNRAMAADQQRQNAIDASAHATALHSLDQQEFKNPATGQTIQASNQYNHQWMSSDGSTLIQTNDHNLDPNGQVYPVSQSWTELVVK